MQITDGFAPVAHFIKIILLHDILRKINGDNIFMLTRNITILYVVNIVGWPTLIFVPKADDAKNCH